MELTKFNITVVIIICSVVSFIVGIIIGLLFRDKL